MASSRLASGRPSGGSTEPQPTKIRRLPSLSITPQPVRRRPGSMPRMRRELRIGGGKVMGLYNPCNGFGPNRAGALSITEGLWSVIGRVDDDSLHLPFHLRFIRPS